MQRASSHIPYTTSSAPHTQPSLRPPSPRPNAAAVHPPPPDFRIPTRRSSRQLSPPLAHAERTLALAKSTRLQISTHLTKSRFLRPNNGIHRLLLRQQLSAPVAPRPRHLYSDDK
ncbi:hypothetical protein J3459_010392 [Metarhizium acridum]|nr:hypothetical protein J3459_010392 [Metarhizium acridum]